MIVLPLALILTPRPQVGLATAPQGWVRTDLVTGETKARWIGTRHFTEEVVVVPKGEGDRRGGGEHPSSECWGLGMVYDARAKRSGLCVLDGETMEVRVPSTFDRACRAALRLAALRLAALCLAAPCLLTPHAEPHHPPH